MTEIRDSIAKDLKKAFEKGDGKLCVAKPTQKDIMTICNKYYLDDPIYYDKCQKEENFCTYCCVAEFGDYYPKDKDKCLNVCLESSSTQKMA